MELQKVTEALIRFRTETGNTDEVCLAKECIKLCIEKES